MSILRETAEALCTLPGVSGHETAIRHYIERRIQESPAEITVSVQPLGNVIARVKGKQPAARTVLFAAHMDEVGLIVTGITDGGLLRFAPVGGVDRRVLFGKQVAVNGLPGVIGGRAVHHLGPEDKGRVPETDKLAIDIGAASREEAEAAVQPGDVALFENGVVPLANGRILSKALDDRAGCALLLSLLDEVPERDIVLAFTVQEEVGCRGAATAAFEVAPAIAVAVDATTAADTAGVPEDEQVCSVEGGAVVSFMDRGTLYDAELYAQILEIAAKEGIPAQPKRLVAGGNDASAMQRAAGGCRAAAVSLPCRYLHSPACVLSERDLKAGSALLKALARELTR